MDYVMDLSESEWGTPAPDRTGSWAIIVLEQGTRQVQGVIGPFRSPGHAQAYACDGGFADWLIVPIPVSDVAHRTGDRRHRGAVRRDHPNPAR